MRIDSNRSKARGLLLIAWGFGFSLNIVAAKAGFAADLTVLLPSYYAHPMLFRKYVEKFKTSPNFIFYETEQEALKLIEGGETPEVAHICLSSLLEFKEKGYLVPWDLARLNMPKLSSGLDLAQQDIDSFRDTFIPIEYGYNRLLYNSDNVPVSDVLSLDVFTNPVYRGQVTLPANLHDLAALAFLAQGVTDFDMVDDTVLEAALDWFRVADTNVHSYWKSEEDLIDILADGSVLVAWAWNSIFYEMQHYVGNIQLAPASSGVSHWTCGYILLDSSETISEEIYTFVSSGLEPSAGRIIVGWGSGFANRVVEEEMRRHVDREQAGLVVQEAHTLVQSPMQPDIWERFKRAVEDIIRRS